MYTPFDRWIAADTKTEVDMSRRFIVIVMLFVVSGLAGLECGRMLAQSMASTTLVLLAPGDIKWESGTRPDIVRAPLWGDRAKGPYGMFNRYDGGRRDPIFSVPGKTRHTDTCKAGIACVVYLTGDAPLDFINVAAK